MSAAQQRQHLLPRRIFYQSTMQVLVNSKGNRIAAGRQGGDVWFTNTKT